MPNRLYRDANGVLQPKIVQGGLPDSTITSAELVDGTIVLADIADGAITDAKVNASAGIVATKLSGVTTPTSIDSFTNKTFDANGTGNSISNIENADISTSAGIVSSKLVLNDTTAIVKNTADPTKTGTFDLSGATTLKGVTFVSSHTDNRTITFPDATDTLVGKATSDILTNKTISGVTITDGTNIILDTTTGTKIGTATTQKLGFYNVTPVVQPTALTTADAGTVDGTYGAEESAVIANLRTRLGELETKLQALGLLA